VRKRHRERHRELPKVRERTTNAHTELGTSKPDQEPSKFTVLFYRKPKRIFLNLGD
jgi:hypothetical protein